MEDGALQGLIADPLLRQVLACRGVKNADDVQVALKQLLHYRDLKDIELAAKLIGEAILTQQHFLIAGDYDVDGLTGTALGVRALHALGAQQVSFYVPSRYEGGYGLSAEVVKAYAKRGVTFVITVDNGISSHEAIECCHKLQLKVVITDHHQPQATLPAADACVDPKREDCRFASKNLCGVGVLFYVLLAVRAYLQKAGYFATHPRPEMENFLDLVALGTIGDVVPLDANNRRLVKSGLKRMALGKTCIGIKSLVQRCKLDLAHLTTQAISFSLCPKLNAAGRLKLASNPAIELLLCDDPKLADELALKLEMCNRRRGDFQRVALKEAEEDAKSQLEQSVLVLHREGWLPGIAGLLAGKLKDLYQKPCFVFTGDDELLQGSARSMKGFSLSQMLNELNLSQPELMVRYGGHDQAAGVVIRALELPRFTELVNQAALKCAVCEEQLLSDGMLPVDHYSLDFARLLESYGPWGNGFPEPCFDGVFYVDSVFYRASIRLILKLEGEGGQQFSAFKIFPSQAEQQICAGDKVKILYSLKVDRYAAQEKLTAQIEMLERL